MRNVLSCTQTCNTFSRFVRTGDNQCSCSIAAEFAMRVGPDAGPSANASAVVKREGCASVDLKVLQPGICGTNYLVASTSPMAQLHPTSGVIPVHSRGDVQLSQRGDTRRRRPHKACLLAFLRR